MSTPRAVDRAVRVPSGGQSLAGMLHLPAGERRAPAVVLCNAFADERRSSCLAMVRLARSLAERGMPALRFDYAGCGDSPGEFADATVETRLADIASAVEFVRSETGLGDVCLAGLRFGATLAARAAEASKACSRLVLLEPVPDGGAYVDALVKRKLVRGMITRSQGGDAPAGGGADVVDLDGYALRAEAIEQMRACRIAEGEVAFRGRVLVVQMSFSKTVRTEAEAVRKAYERAGARVEVRTLVMPPLWSRIDIVPTDPLNDTVGEWLAGSA